MDKLDAIILAGGLGTRLREVVNDRPKVLAQVCGHPFLDFILASLNQSGCIGKVILAVGYMAERIIEHYSESGRFSFSIEFSVEDKLLGTGGAVKKAISLSQSNKLIVLNGDSFVDFCFSDLVEFYDKHCCQMVITLVEVDDSSRFGTVITDSEERVISFIEKSSTSGPGYVNAGIYLLHKSIFENVAADMTISLEREIIPSLLDKGIYGYKTHGRFIDIGTPESYNRSSAFFNDTGTDLTEF